MFGPVPLFVSSKNPTPHVTTQVLLLVNKNALFVPFRSQTVQLVDIVSHS
jgi:hypothetical protein